MKIIKFEELVSHDVLEFCYSSNYPKHWNANSVFVIDDDFFRLSPYIEQVIPNYKYFGPQKVKLEEWKRVEKLALEKNEFREFFYKIDEWRKNDPEQKDYFWVQGV